jgi:hypothetical protein
VLLPIGKIKYGCVCFNNFFVIACKKKKKNSANELVESVKQIENNQILNSIETWFTRGTYKNAKPDVNIFVFIEK